MTKKKFEKTIKFMSKPFGGAQMIRSYLIHTTLERREEFDVPLSKTTSILYSKRRFNKFVSEIAKIVKKSEDNVRTILFADSINKSKHISDMWVEFNKSGGA